MSHLEIKDFLTSYIVGNFEIMVMENEISQSSWEWRCPFEDQQ